MKILILGGTQMIGRDLVETLIVDGTYDITIANRGLTNPTLFSGLKRLIIDRNDTDSCSVLGVLEDYDVVIDCSCYNILQYNNVVHYLKDIKKYILISTMSVLDINFTNSDERYISYAMLKKELEQKIVPPPNIRSTIIARPCAIYGDNDYTNRFNKIDDIFYWKNTTIRADKNSGCLSVQELSARLLKLIQSPIETTKTQIVNITP